MKTSGLSKNIMRVHSAEGSKFKGLNLGCISIHPTLNTTGKRVLAPLKLTSNAPVLSFEPPNKVKFHFGTGKEFTGNNDLKFLFQEKKALQIKKVQKVVEKEEITESECVSKVIESNAGEENDQIILESPAKLYTYTVDPDSQKGEYLNRANGVLHFNKSSGFYRIIIRNSIGKLCLNQRVFSSMKPIPVKDTNIRLLLQYDDKINISLIQVQNIDARDKLLNEIEKAMKQFPEIN